MIDSCQRRFIFYLCSACRHGEKLKYPVVTYRDEKRHIEFSRNGKAVHIFENRFRIYEYRCYHEGDKEFYVYDIFVPWPPGSPGEVRFVQLEPPDRITYNRP